MPFIIIRLPIMRLAEKPEKTRLPVACPLNDSLAFLIVIDMISGSKGLNSHELAHKWVKDLGTRKT